MIKKIYGDIARATEQLVYADTLPSKEAIMFLNGNHYETGSDYSEDYLSQDINEIKEEVGKINVIKELNIK